MDRFFIEEWLKQGVIFSHSPQKILLGWGNISWHAFPGEGEEGWYYFPDFFLNDERPWLYCENNCIVNTEKLLEALKMQLEVISPIHWEFPSKENFQREFCDLQKIFSTTDLKKAVPYAFLHSSISFLMSHRKRALVSALEYLQKAPVFIYGFWTRSEGMLGVTPELLFQLKGKNPQILQSMALAGTEKTALCTSKIYENTKLLYEHELVVKDLIARLEKLGVVNVEELQLLRLPVLSHLYTPISVQLHDTCDFITLVHALHPTPALGGFPQNLALQWLHKYNETIPRGRFGAPVGFWNRKTDTSICYVAIRNVMWNQQKASIGAGCGVVPKSILEEEWQEILLKMESIVQFLQL